MIKIVDYKDTHYRSYCDIGHNKGGIMWAMHQGRLHTAFDYDGYQTHGKTAFGFELDGVNWRESGRYDPETQIISCSGQLSNSTIRKLLKKFPDAIKIVNFSYLAT